MWTLCLVIAKVSNLCLSHCFMMRAWLKPITFHRSKKFDCQGVATQNTIFMDLVKYLSVSMILFLLGIWGIFLNRKNIIIMLMSIELMLLAVNLNFLIFSVYLDDLIGQLFALLVLTVAAAESAIGLALLVVYYRIRGTIAVEFINLIKG